MVDVLLSGFRPDTKENVMKEVCLVWEQGGSYDSSYDNVILAFETLAEGEAAVAAIESEMKQVWQLGSCFNYANSQPRLEGENWVDSHRRLTAEWDQKVQDICKVYPIVCNTGITGVVNINVPDSDNDVEFYAVMQPISKLPEVK